MQIKTLIQHRVNTIDDLLNTSSELGMEFDLRTDGGEIIMNHDPFKEGTSFKEYLQKVNHNTLILNTKEDGLEDDLIALMDQHNIRDYFFLDTTIPTLVKLSRRGFSKMAVRFSEVEPLEFVDRFRGKAEWVWVDCFAKNILTREAYLSLKADFKICIVSPELQGHPLEWIADFRSAFKGFDLDAVCTKKPGLWR